MHVRSHFGPSFIQALHNVGRGLLWLAGAAGAGPVHVGLEGRRAQRGGGRGGPEDGGGGQKACGSVCGGVEAGGCQGVGAREAEGAVVSALGRRGGAQDGEDGRGGQKGGGKDEKGCSGGAVAEGEWSGSQAFTATLLFDPSMCPSWPSGRPRSMRTRLSVSELECGTSSSSPSSCSKVII